MPIAPPPVLPPVPVVAPVPAQKVDRKANSVKTELAKAVDGVEQTAHGQASHATRHKWEDENARERPDDQTGEFKVQPTQRLDVVV